MADGGDDPDYKVGRGKPPLEGRIKVGEIRNRWGRNGKPKPPVKAKPAIAYASLKKAMSRMVKARLPDGSLVEVTVEDGYYIKLTNDALSGKVSAQRILASINRDYQKSLPVASDIPVGAVVLRVPCWTDEEFEARAEEEMRARPKNAWADLPGYDPETNTYNGIPVDLDTGELVRTPNFRWRDTGVDVEDDD